MSVVFDFGFEGPSASWKDAFVAVLFSSGASEGEMASTPGPAALADTSRYIELFEMQIGASPLSMGLYSELVGGKDPDLETAKRAEEARSSGKIPLLIGGTRRLTGVTCRDPLVALWGKVGRPESKEATVFENRRTVVAGVRAATALAFKSFAGNISIVPARHLVENSTTFKDTLGKVNAPVHLSIDLDVLAPGVVQNRRSVEPGGLSWYHLLDAIDAVAEGPGIAAVDITGTESVGPRSPAACLGAQLILRIAGILTAGASR